MRVDRDALIAGLPPLRVRDALKHCREPHGFYPEQLFGHLGVTAANGERVLAELVRLGYVQAYEDCWRTTTAGNALAMAKATRPVPSTKAQAELTAFLARVASVNASDRFLYQVEEVILFGSFLDPGVDPVGDVDVAVTLRHKPTDEDLTELALQHARRSGRRFSSFVDEMLWPELEVRLYLKARSRVMSIATTDDGVLDQAPHKTIYSLA